MADRVYQIILNNAKVITYEGYLDMTMLDNNIIENIVAFRVKERNPNTNRMVTIVDIDMEYFNKQLRYYKRNAKEYQEARDKYNMLANYIFNGIGTIAGANNLSSIAEYGGVVRELPNRCS